MPRKRAGREHPREPSKDALTGEALDATEITKTISALALERNGGSGWILGFAVAFILLMLLLLSVIWVFSQGGAFKFRWPGDLRLSTSFGGSGSGTPARSFPQFFCCCIKTGAIPSTV